MSKVEIVGPKELLLATLELLRGKGVFHPEADIHGFVAREDELHLKELLLDEATVGEKLFFVSLQQRILELLACLPDLPARTSYLQPLPVVDVLNDLVDKHLAACQETQEQRQKLREELDALSRHLSFWTLLEPLVAAVDEHNSLAFFGVKVRNPNEIQSLEQVLEQQLAGRCRISTAAAEDGSLVALITTDRGMEEKLRKLLSTEQVPELSLPEDLAGLPFKEKSSALRRFREEKKARLDTLSQELETFARRWLPIYRQALNWLGERLSLYQASAAAYETRQCFLVHGWMASEGVEALEQSLSREFSGQVVLNVLQMREEDWERAPVLLRNPLYFKPFELFARLLPLPKYSSYDPTPFLGVFFPLLFGMILGDVGYGLLLTLVSFFLVRRYPQYPNLSDGAKILGVSALYTILFGFLYGELFGDLGEHLFHLQPLWKERSQAIVPMIVFAISVGVAHILIGLGFGIRSDFRRRQKREALLKIITLLLILSITLWLVDLLLPLSWDLTLPLLLVVALLVTLLVIAGGLLAPLELLKSFGNIISYVRIMAIGLCSVLLAQVANQLGGMTGDILAGVLVAGVLHFFNLLLGVFAPTVHTLRLHYVEFFSKFMDFGGRRFKPLKKDNQSSPIGREHNGTT